MLVGKIMLLGKDHAGGEASCLWERIVLVLQDDEECRNVVFAPKNYFFNNPFMKNQVFDIEF